MATATVDNAPARVPARAIFAAPAVAVLSLVTAWAVTSIAGVPLRDPDGVAGSRLLFALSLVAGLVFVDVYVRSATAAGTWHPSPAALVAVARGRWNRHRLVPLCMALFAFFVTYFAYRNLKSVVPLIRPGDLFDAQLTTLDKALFGGRQPAVVLHEVLGTGLAAQVLSAAYLLLFMFIPVTLAASLVFSSRLEAGLFYATALSLNWVIGAGSYYVLPSLGPFQSETSLFNVLPATSVGNLQEWLVEERFRFFTDPTAPGAAQSIGAFASLHVSIFVTGALAAHLLGMRRWLKAVLWVGTGLTVLSTIYFGWHYLLDDLGGVMVAVLALAVARVLTGVQLDREREAIARDRATCFALPEALRRLRVSLAVPAGARAVLSPPLVALVTLAVALIATGAAGVRFRDPDNVAAVYLVLVGAAVAALVGVDIWVRAARRIGFWRPPPAVLAAVRRERWTRRRGVAVAVALVSFYLTYLAYRNLKGVIPFLGPERLFDAQLADADRALFLGSDPATLLHGVLGTGISAHVLSTVYAAFIVFLPLSLAVALVFARDLRTTLMYATALCLNWLLGAASYFVWPALGPVYADPGMFAALPHTHVSDLQQMLLDDRVAWLRDTASATPQAIAAFASLHIAMSVTAVLAAQLLGLGRRLRIALWLWLGTTTVATVYLGWHYVVDDVAGIALGAAALWLAKLMTGFDFGAARLRERRLEPVRPVG